MTLNDMYDVTVDYGGEGAAALGESNDSVTVRTELVDANRVGNYAVSNIAWSPQHSELMLASYSKVSPPPPRTIQSLCPSTFTRACVLKSRLLGCSSRAKQ
jgi:hypothetical protein